SGFAVSSQTVSPASLASAASAEGAASRVITALSYNQGNITYLSYSWQQDTSTVYEVQVANATFASLQGAAQNLASHGYIITAVGGNSALGLILVGTRVHGNTAARPILFVTVGSNPTVDALISGGYAVVAGFQAIGGAQYWIGER